MNLFNREESKKFFDEAFKGNNPPKNLRRISERICTSYGITGICDPMYICNIIALELGFGDGQSNFTGYIVSK